jgi:hypothetical protein
LLSFEDHAGNTVWHINQKLGGHPGLNIAETNQGDGRLFLATGGNVGIGTLNPGFRLEVTGTVCAQQFCNPSDVRLKRDVLPLRPVLDRLVDVRGVTYEPVVDGAGPRRRQVGVLAHEVEQAFPELVVQMGETGYQAVDYAGFAGVLVEAVHELLATNAVMAARLGALEEQVAAGARDAR